MILRDDIARHRKFLLAGEIIGGGNGSARALALYVAAIGYAREQLTNGFIDDAFVTKFLLDSDAKLVAKALAARKVHLFHRVRGGYQIHDFDQYNGSADKLKHQRELAKERKRRQRAGQTVENPVENVPVTRDQSVTGEMSRVTMRDVTPSTETETEKEREVRTSVPGTYAPPVQLVPPEDVRESVPGSLSVTRDTPPPLAHGAYQTGLVNVPVFIHAKLVARLVNTGVVAADAERLAFDFYARECAKRQGQRIGDSEPKFWDARIAEWLGTTTVASGSSTRPRPSVGLHNAAVLARRRGQAS